MKATEKTALEKVFWGAGGKQVSAGAFREKTENSGRGLLGKSARVHY